MPPTKTTTRRTLRELSRARRQAAEETHIVMNEVQQGSDRSACIIMSAMVERFLERELLMRLMISESTSKHQALLERDGALSTFFGNIHLAYALDMISQDMKDDLDILRKIRNAFAHSELPITFQSDEVKREINKLRYDQYSDLRVGESSPLSAERGQFVTCCLALIAKFGESVESYLKFQQDLITIASRDHAKTPLKT